MVSGGTSTRTIDVRMLLPLQAVKFWPLIENALKHTLPSDNGSLKPANLNRFYEDMMNGQYQVWVGFDQQRPILMATTCVLDETGTDRRVLLLYTLTSVDGTPQEFFGQGLNVLRNYALSMKCSEIWAYSDDKAIVRLAKELGANTDWVQIRFPLEARHENE